jgi:hypothetical protein
MNNYDEDVTIMTLNADIAELQHKLTSETARADKAEGDMKELIKIAYRFLDHIGYDLPDVMKVISRIKGE